MIIQYMQSYLFLLSIVISTISWSQTNILSTDFQSGIPISYSIVDNDGNLPDNQVSIYTSAWIVISDPEDTADSVASSTSYFSPNGVADRWLITPPLSLGAYGNSIEWRAKSKDASYPDDYLVMVSETDTDITSFTDTIGYIIEENFEWTSRYADLSSFGYNNQTVFIAFRNITDDGFVLFLDDIKVWVEDPASIAEISNNSVNIYPNPVNDILTVESISAIENILLTDANGSVIVNTNESTLNLTGINPGLYNLLVMTEKGAVWKKVIKF